MSKFSEQPCMRAHIWWKFVGALENCLSTRGVTEIIYVIEELAFADGGISSKLEPGS
jgi:hypothetical protein